MDVGILKGFKTKVMANFYCIFILSLQMPRGVAIVKSWLQSGMNLERNSRIVKMLLLLRWTPLLMK